VQGLNVTQTSRDISFCGHAILEHDLMIVPNAREDPKFSDNPLVTGEMQVVFYAGCPIRSSDGSHVGAFCVTDTVPRDLSEHDRQTLRDLAMIVESELRCASHHAVENRVVGSLTADRRRAMVDQLTRLWNRVGIGRIADEMFAMLQDADAGMGVGIIRLDNHDQIVDEHGDADDVLRQIGKRGVSAIRSTDAIGRLNENEFVILYDPCASELQANEMLARARAVVSDKPIRTDDAEIRIEVSGSIAFLNPGAATTLDDALAWLRPASRVLRPGAAAL
jgi:diguanylate cyclase (GGDEF)-like protein